jgi:hypothetical protein
MMNIVFILLSVAPVIAIDLSIAESTSLVGGNSTDCPADNGNGYAYGVGEYNWKCHIPQAFSEVENLTINATIVKGTPHWIFFAAGTQEKGSLLNYFEGANVSEKQKDNWAQFIRNMWKQHPVDFDNSTGNPTLVPRNSLDTFSLNSEENATFQEIEQYIADDMEKARTEEINVKWYAKPTHKTFMELALQPEDIPINLKTIAADAAPNPDDWDDDNPIPFAHQINHGYVPGIGGLAPTNFGLYTYTAKLMYISHDYSGAFTHMGYASHFMTDLGNPYHTPPVQLIPLENIDSPLSQIIFPNSQMILNYESLHNKYEEMVADHWNLFYTGNQDRYDIYEPTLSATAHGTASWAVSYPLIYSCYWHFVNKKDFNFETNSAIVSITQNRIVESMKNTRGLVRYVTGGEYPMLTISATAGPGGSISPSGDVSVRYGEGRSFTITPSAGYIIDKILVDNNPVSENPYSFSSITSDHTISGTFRENLPSIVPLVQAGTPFNSLKYPQNWPQSDPMTFQCNWDGNGRVYISGDQSDLTGVWADDGFIIIIQPSGETFDAIPHYSCAHYILDLTSGMRPGVNSLTLTVKNWQGLSMSYGSKNGVDIDQTPYIIQVNSPTVAATGDTTSIEGLPSFIEPKDNGFVINDTFIDT